MMKNTCILFLFTVFCLMSYCQAMEEATTTLSVDKGQYPQFDNGEMIDKFILAVGTAGPFTAGSEHKIVPDRRAFDFEGKVWIIETQFYEKMLPYILRLEIIKQGAFGLAKFTPIVKKITFNRMEKEANKNRCYYNIFFENNYLRHGMEEILEFRMTFLDKWD